MATSTPSVQFRNGYKMPILGFGTSRAVDEEVVAAIDAALEAGYRHIDTAFMYHNEGAIGDALKKWLDSGRIKREELFIVTKLPSFGNRAEGVEKFLKKSLEALKLNYVDLYLIHNPVGLLDQDGVPMDQKAIDYSTDHLAIWKAMEAQVDAGRARSIGLSNFNSRQIKRIVKAARIPPANLQVKVNVHYQQRELTAFCKALDVTVCAFAPLGAPGAKRDNSTTPVEGPLTDPIVLEVAKKHSKTPAQVLIRHLIHRGIVAIPKSVNPARIRENFQVFDFQLDDEDIEKLNTCEKGSKARFGSRKPREGNAVRPNASKDCISTHTGFA